MLCSTAVIKINSIKEMYLKDIALKKMLWAPEWRSSKTFTLSLGDREFKSQRNHTHPWPGAQESQIK